MTSPTSDVTAYYLVRTSQEAAALWIAESDIPASVSIAVLTGRPVKPRKQPYTAYFKTNSGKPLDLLTGVVAVPVVSEHMRKAVSKFPDSIEFHAVRVQSRKKPSLHYPYFIMNVLGTVDGFDWDRSKYERTVESEHTPVVGTVTRLVLKPSAIGNHHLFRISAFPAHLMISARGKELLDSQGVTGIRYQPVSEFSSIGG